MDLDDLRRYIAVAALSNITEAASVLHVTQPTLSRSIARLESEFGLKLFDRIGRNIKINEQGRIVEDHARRALAELEGAREKVGAAMDPNRGLVRIGHLFSLGRWLVPPLIRDFRQERPAVNFTFQEARPKDLEAALREHTLDVAIISPRPVDRSLAWVHLHREWLHLTVRPDHPFATRKSIYIHEVEGQIVITQRHVVGVHKLVRDLAARTGVHIDFTVRTDSISSLRGLVLAGMGVSLETLPRNVPANVFAELVDIPIADENAYRDVGIIWNRRSPLSAATKAFIDFTIDWAPRQPHVEGAPSHSASGG